MPIFVNNIEISDDEVHAEMQHHPSKNVDEARHKAAHALVIKKLLLLEAVEQKLIADLESCPAMEEEDVINRLVHKEVNFKQADDANCQLYFKNNPQRFIDQSTGRALPFELVHTYIREYLETRSLQTGINHYLKRLVGKAQIVGFQLEGSEGPFVQ